MLLLNPWRLQRSQSNPNRMDRIVWFLGGGPMSTSSSLIRRSFILPVAFALAFSALVSAAQAQSARQLDKHARKIEKRLTKYRQGTYLDIDHRDGSQTYGSLGELAETSFQFTDADSNKVESNT